VGLTIALAGDTMLGRGVADRLAQGSPSDLVAPEVAELTRAADLFLLNLECCISARGEPWPDPAKRYFFRAPPEGIELLSHLGVDAVTMANNHALDFGPEALCDTLLLLEDAGVRTVGAGRDRDEARRPLVLQGGDLRLAVVAVTDHPPEFEAAVGRPGVAYADLQHGLPEWLTRSLVDVGKHVDLTLVTPHWGPNMVTEPVPHVRRAAEELLDAGADLIAGHSAHLFHGVRMQDGGWPIAVLFDLGEFLDDYAVDERRRNDLGVLWLMELDADGPVRLEAVPLRLRFARTELATGDDRAWVARRLITASAALGTQVEDTGRQLVIHRDR
jgi:poly-gamma-glutamate capsule biosynthesis protein CapA/YwtB (metallophosphatase superfamily)